MKILLIRHGDPDYEHDTLTEQGWVEAELLARPLLTTFIFRRWDGRRTPPASR